MSDTQGPWRAERAVTDAPFGRWIVRDASGDMVGGLVSEPIAHLLEAAPALRDALRVAVDILEHLYGCREWDFGPDDDGLAKARVALAMCGIDGDEHD